MPAPPSARFRPSHDPALAKNFGWEISFIIIGALGFIWMGFWVFLYDRPETSKHVSKEELAYIEQDKELDNDKHPRTEPRRNWGSWSA